MSTPPLIIVGMHRSGTSFVASLLNAAGLDLGSRLMPAARGNERGHFENMDFVDFHMHWLRLTGHDDSGWAALQPLTLPAEAISEARHLLEQNARDTGWGWKDPRATLFLDFWSEVVPDANYLYIYREPGEVIDSLYRRGDRAIELSPELAARAYLTHNGMMLDHLRRHRDRSFVANVSAIARDPEAFLAQISDRFDIDLDAHAPSTFESGLMRTTAPDAPLATLLRHHVPEIDEQYATLEELADAPDASGERKRSRTENVKTAFFTEWLLGFKRDAEIRSVRKALETSEASNAKRGEHLVEAERVLSDERAERALVTQQLESAMHQLSLNHDSGIQLRAEHDSVVRQLRDEAEQAQGRNRGLEQRLKTTTHDLLAQTEALVATTRAENDKLKLLIDTVQSSTFWKIKRGVNRVLRSLHLARR